MKQLQNALYYGDNLEILRKFVKDESVDLCYIDPPFNSKRNYFQIYHGVNDQKDSAQAKAFVDTWKWDVSAESGLDEIKANAKGQYPDKLITLISGLHMVLGSKAMMAYLIHITLRANEIFRVLKPTGSFYLHCDPTASHYLKIILDCIFLSQNGRFVNELIWNYQTGGASKRWYAKKHDVIFFYAKTKDYAFYPNEIREARSEKSLERAKCTTGARISVDDVDKLPTSVLKIPALNPMSKERLGYPTQKPEELLEKIIKGATKPGDVVLDAYCGCGTSVAVAQKLGRRWIGIDITYQSISLIKDRMAHAFPDTWNEVSASIREFGIPSDRASLDNFINSKEDRLHKELEKWAILTFSQNCARINDKKGGDGGIDGRARFLANKDSAGKNVFGNVLFQAKCNKGTPEQVRALRTNLVDEGADVAFFLHEGNPTAGMKEQAEKAGYYKHPLFPNKKIRKIQFVSLMDIVDGSTMDLTVISPIKHAEAFGHQNLELFDDEGDEE